MLAELGEITSSLTPAIFDRLNIGVDRTVKSLLERLAVKLLCRFTLDSLDRSIEIPVGWTIDKSNILLASARIHSLHQGPLR